MTQQDIEKLKALCEKEGFELDFISQSTQGAMDIFRVSKKDEWEGVEFAECLVDVNGDWYVKEIAKGQIYRIVDWFKRELIYIDKHELGWESKHFKPSTEAAYVEQLKAKAKELYGEIKDGDVFDRREICSGGTIRDVFHDYNKEYSYSKHNDTLYLGSLGIYKQGKWAKKVEEPIKANISSFTLSNPYSTIVFTTSHRIKEGQVDAKEFMNHIEESIEAFLNRKP